MREDVVTAALGAVPPEERSRLDAHLAGCLACADERDVAARLVAAQRAAPAVPVPAGGLARILAAVRSEAAPAGGSAAPIHALPARRRGVLRWARLVLPTAAAAAVLVAILSAGDERISARIGADAEAILRDTSGETSDAGVRVGAEEGSFELTETRQLEAGAVPVDVALGLGRAPGPSQEPGRDEVRLTLLPGARVAALGRDALELRAGRVRLRVGPLSRRLTVRAGSAYARILGTRFEAARIDDRLVVAVEEGVVELGYDGPGRRSVRLAGGERGLAGPGRLLSERADRRDPVEALLAPVARLTGPSGRLSPREPLDLDAEIECGPGGAVTLAPFDASEPRFLVRLKGPDGREREVKVLPSMLGNPREDPLAVRIEEGRPYRLRLRIPLGEAPADGPGPAADAAEGAWEARLRYHSYRPRDAAEWLGTVESAEVRFEVRRE
jgi:ferric-dicitrate binding protein FerR (iron transport regulator)